MGTQLEQTQRELAVIAKISIILWLVYRAKHCNFPKLIKLMLEREINFPPV